MNDRQAWLEARRKGIGGSDVAPICGLSPWKTPLDVYLDKIGEGQELADNEPMYWGRAIEPLVRQRYANETGLEVVVPNEILASDKHPFMLANLDGLVARDRVVEIKTARSAQNWGEPGTGEIPEYYQLQVQHYMNVTGLPVADVAVLFGGQDFQIYTVDADPELQEIMVEREAEFWNEHVKKGVPPDPVTFADVQQRFGRTANNASVQVTDEVMTALSELKNIKDLKAREEEVKSVIMKHMGEADTLVAGDMVLATWKLSRPRKSFDGKAFSAANPELYKQYVRKGKPSRRFLLKK